MSERPKKKVVNLSGNCEVEEKDGVWSVHFPHLDLRATGPSKDEAMSNLIASISELIPESEDARARWEEFCGANLIEQEYTDEELRAEQELLEKSKEASKSFRSIALEELDGAATSERPVLIDFWAEWCKPCHMMAPELKTASDNLAGKLEVLKMNVDDNKEAWERFSIEGIPTLILFRGGEEVHRILGARMADDIVSELAPHLS